MYQQQLHNSPHSSHRPMKTTISTAAPTQTPMITATTVLSGSTTVAPGVATCVKG